MKKFYLIFGQKSPEKDGYVVIVAGNYDTDFEIAKKSLDGTSTRSVLILWVEAFEANAGILGGKLPVNPGLFGIAFVLPRLDFLS